MSGINKRDIPNSLKEKLKGNSKEAYTMGELKVILGIEKRRNVRKHIEVLENRGVMSERFNPERSTMEYVIV